MADRIINWPEKPPEARLDYLADLTVWAAQALGDVIDEVALVGIEPDDGELVVDTPTITNGVVTAWISGGTHGTRYAITIEFSTSGGREDRFVALLPVVDLAERVADRVGADQTGG